MIMPRAAKEVEKLKFFCENCDGEKGFFVNDGSGMGDTWQVCEICDGQGFEEVEGNLEDLELAQAVKEIFKLPLSYIVPSTHSVSIGTSEELINWYREQKGGK